MSPLLCCLICHDFTVDGHKSGKQGISQNIRGQTPHLRLRAVSPSPAFSSLSHSSLMDSFSAHSSAPLFACARFRREWSKFLLYTSFCGGPELTERDNILAETKISFFFASFHSDWISPCVFSKHWHDEVILSISQTDEKTQTWMAGRGCHFEHCYY